MEKSIRVDYYYFNYFSLGNTSKPPIIFLHGFLGDCYEFQEVMARLSHDFYCIAIALPGHGKTKVVGDANCYTMASTADGLIQFLEVLQIKKCFLVGYSMGGRLALYLTLRFPTYFHKVILESASPGLKTQAARNQRIQSDSKLAQALEMENFSSFLAKWYAQPLFASMQRHPDFERILAHRLQNNPFALAKSLRNLGLGCQPSLWIEFQQNVIPLLLVVGELDRKFVSINTEMANLCKAAQLQIMSSCGHNIHFEDANSFIEQIRCFLFHKNTQLQL